jgi:glutaredoxin
MLKLRRAVLNSNEKETPDAPMNCIFMYVKNYCRYSKRAAAAAVKQSNNVRCIDMVNRVPIDPVSFQPIEGKVDTHLLQAFAMKNYLTVPQIFVYDTKWRYVGGCDDFLAIVDNRASGTQATAIESLGAMFQVKL